jgi:hypothetical protein
MKDESIMDLMAGIKVLADEIVPPNKTRQSLRAAISAIAAYPYRDSIRAAAHKRWAHAVRQFLLGNMAEAYKISQSIIYDLGERK